MGKLEDVFGNVLGSFSEKLSQNKILKGMTDSFMLVTPITLGVAVIAVLANLPIPAWQDLLGSIGINAVANDFISLTLSLLAIYLAVAASHRFARQFYGKDETMISIITMACYLAMIPIQTTEEGTAVIPLSDLGSDGIFVALIMGIIIPFAYSRLMKMNLQLKLPDAVPPNVSAALSPTFVNMILFSAVFAVKYIFTLTPFGDIFTCISTLIQTPLVNAGSSAWALIIIQVLVAFLWFFGIHPNTVSAVTVPILLTTMSANIEAYSAGKPLPYLAAGIVYYVLVSDAVGNTLSLCINTFFAKSEKYKSMRNLITPANIFNINEPIIFGFPIMLNPLYFIPMLLVTLANGIAAVIYMELITIPLNPAVYMAWVTPRPVFTFLAGGWQFLLLWVICLVLDTIIWRPFFMIDDHKEYQAELERVQNHAE